MDLNTIPKVIIEPVPLAHDLRDVRDEMARVQAERDELEKKLRDVPAFNEWEGLAFSLAKLRTQETLAKERLAAELVKAYNVTGDKKYPGIGDVAIRRKVQYEDAPAIKWAISAGMHALLKVDRSAADKAFEGLADNLDFVEVVEEPFARVSSKLEI